MQIEELWQELDDEQAANISGGEDWSIAWSIGFADVVRPSTSKTPGSVIVQIGMRSDQRQERLEEHCCFKP